MKNLALAFLLLTIVSCSSKWDEANLHGKWKVESWIVNSSGKKISQQMDFTFYPDKNYEVDYGTEKEIGTWYLAGDYLHTKENGSIDKSVMIKHLSQEAIQFEMNRAGSLEFVTLKRPGN